MSLQTFAEIIGPIRLVAHELGYAIAVHGSLKRDIDLVAIPWTSVAVSKELLLAKICDRIGGLPTAEGWRKRPHGRFVQIVRLKRCLEDGGTYLDFSVMDLQDLPPAPGTHLGNGVIQP